MYDKEVYLNPTVDHANKMGLKYCVKLLQIKTKKQENCKTKKNPFGVK